MNGEKTNTFFALTPGGEVKLRVLIAKWSTVVKNHGHQKTWKKGCTRMIIEKKTERTKKYQQNRLCEKNGSKVKDASRKKDSKSASNSKKRLRYKQRKLKLKIKLYEKKKNREEEKKNSDIFSTLQVELMQNIFKPHPRIPIDDLPSDYHVDRCPQCGSRNVIKKGYITHRIRKPMQRFQCKNCSDKDHVHTFVNSAERHFHLPLSHISLILDLVIRGDSANSIKKILKNYSINNYPQGITVSKQSIINITIKVHKLLSNFEYFLYHRYQSYEWQIDDMYQRRKRKKIVTYIIDKFKNKKKQEKYRRLHAYVTNVLAVDSRFLLASFVSIKRDNDASIKALFISKKRAKYSPKVIKSDGWQPHVNAASALFPNTLILPVPKRINKAFVNFVERLNGTVRTYGLKRLITFQRIEFLEAKAELSRIHYNFFKPHSALDGKTPAQAAGITISFETWEDLIRYADYLDRYYEL